VISHATIARSFVGYLGAADAEISHALVPGRCAG
jgi:hypothetical protein